MKLKVIKPALIALTIAGVFSGCAVKEAPRKVKCGPPDFCMQKPKPKPVIKKVYVSECPKKVKTVVYGSICDDCSNFPVSVREKSCCIEGGCK